MKKTDTKLKRRLTWLVYSSAAVLNTALLYVAVMDPPKTPHWLGD